MTNKDEDSARMGQYAHRKLRQEFTEEQILAVRDLSASLVVGLAAMPKAAALATITHAIVLIFKDAEFDHPSEAAEALVAAAQRIHTESAARLDMESRGGGN